MDRFSTLQVFLRVIDRGSFTQAARELGLGQPSVSKQIAALESRLGTQLLNRTSRGLQPTAAGRVFYESAVQLLNDLEDAETRVGRSSVSPAGLIRVATPPALGRMYIIPHLPAFFARFPDVAVEFSVSERRLDLVKDGIDVALRVGNMRDSSLISKRIGSLRTSTVATQDYLDSHGVPDDPEDLREHNLVVGQFQGASVGWHFKVQDSPFSLEPSGNLKSNDAEDLRAAVLTGLGIGHSATALFSGDLKAGRVVSILDDFAPDPLPIHAVSASGRRTPNRVRMFIDFVAELFASEPSLSIN
jgi:DNA-binding transcriptional LysR family regulator